ncbi:monocopper oxidase-like protein SKU5 [Amborella trichopoda]|uniref:monocopper oxidase-like protein SKU5 n=1 Tax=Amborella trichopoda TaxID=13333 RepID=UPI0005D405E0|nr:monocopper oxidase-like protein SKU5 [Amborella trichopoda]|eukprot:XP_011621392.1 monocopper oxidase-like protein SKU5 [Amborella trichopoda]
MDLPSRARLVLLCVSIFIFLDGVSSIDIFLDWNVSSDLTIAPVGQKQLVITINGMFPGPLINCTTNDFIHVNIFNNLDEPFLMTWNGIQQRLNSWQDGVSGTNCPIQPGTNWTYAFQTKDQIGSFFYFPSTLFQKAAGGFGPIRVNNRIVINVPFDKPAEEFDVLIGDWYFYEYKNAREILSTGKYDMGLPQAILINGKAPYNNPWSKEHEIFTVTQGQTYRFRISNVGLNMTLNFRIQNHKMKLVETEGSYTSQIMLDSLDVHVGQSYSVLVTADQNAGNYFMVASPRLVTTADNPNLMGIAVLHYDSSTTAPIGSLPVGPDQLDQEFSVNQARSIRWNMTTGAARPNPQGTFNVTNVTINQTFILHSFPVEIEGNTRFTVNNISYLTPTTPLKLADHALNGSGVYILDAFPTNAVSPVAAINTSVVTGIHKGWIEIVFANNAPLVDTWHLDGFGFYVVGFGEGVWSKESRATYNLFDPVVRSTVQVYPAGWTVIYAFLDNPGMWNLRSQRLQNWFLGQELYIRVHNDDPNPAKERPPPDNLLTCGILEGVV